MKEIKISVVIPTFQGRQKLEKMIFAVLGQSFQELELVVVVDGSTDGTEEMLEGLSKNHDRLTYVIQENRGIAHSLGAGLERARGEYILCLDHDDDLDGQALAKMYGAAADNEVVSFGFTSNHSGGSWRFPAQETILRDEDIQLGNGMLWTKLIKASLLRELDFSEMPRLTYEADKLISLLLALKRPKTVLLDECLYHYYPSPHSATNNLTEGYLANFLRYFGYVEYKFKEAGFFQSHRNYLLDDIRGTYTWARTRLAPEHLQDFKKFLDLKTLEYGSYE